MSTLVSYLLAVILQFMGVSMPKEHEPVSELTNQKCRETTSVQQYSFINNNEQVLKTSKKEL